MHPEMVKLILAGLVIGTGLMAGLFFVFSNFALSALARIEPSAGVAAMQSINRVILNPWFLAIFIGTAIVSLLVAVLSVIGWHDALNSWSLAGACLYLIGTFLVTVVFNVPLNDQLEAVSAHGSEATAIWKHYVTHWLPWNHVRTASSILAMSAFVLALL